MLSGEFPLGQTAGLVFGQETLTFCGAELLAGRIKFTSHARQITAPHSVPPDVPPLPLTLKVLGIEGAPARAVLKK